MAASKVTVINGRRASKTRRHEATLAAYKAVSDEYHEIERERKRLRGEVDLIPAGTYGEYQKAFGTPSRTVDMDAVARRYEELGEVLPTREKAPPLQVKRV